MFENFNEELNKELSGKDFKDAIESLKDLDDKTKAIVIMAAGAGVAVTVGVGCLANGIKKIFDKKKNDKIEVKVEIKDAPEAEKAEKVDAEVVEEPKKEEAGADQK